MGAEEPDVAPEERDCNGAALGAQGDPTQPHRDELGDAFDLVKRHLTPPPTRPPPPREAVSSGQAAYPICSGDWVRSCAS